MKYGRSIAITAICVLLGMIMAWQYKSIDYNEREKSLERKSIEELKDELIREQRNNENLSVRNAELEKENKEYENSKGDVTKETQILKHELERARIIAGLVDVKGKGVVITIDNDLVDVTESNLLNVVNELRASDAQAISINDERIVGSSEIREAGRKFIMINGKQMRAPFVIKAIANPEKLDRALMLLGGVLDSLEELKVELKKQDNIIINKVRDDGSVIKTDLLTPIVGK
ncbi:DUF881 domain-containing protein [Pseudobacteroides cellulosolvens]|uniref:DUF881 domain-containing protein n=1 Tax=Pseudobacteroides cellulosolvens ATCC 35603 = DSM 2933 TaxID=398512 RepID=A0A0L6JJ93_9FIRM|nr:DUF881 domain-containing protein [Pseudobacteroides cellulosolvens]KNY25748.1 protein of unknown function DUF881 [Pseudobacteroides cellulosolvens ATCC 35603 = DSM 2933]